MPSLFNLLSQRQGVASDDQLLVSGDDPRGDCRILGSNQALHAADVIGLSITLHIIAAIGPVIKAKDSDMSVALATIFVLNAIALFIFPVFGHWLGMTEQEFGTWAAIAIHDTSSVVGAGAAYGEEALQVATTIKLTRALWIIPLALVTSFIFKGKDRKISIPWFILWFIVAMLINTYALDNVPEVGKAISGLARKGLIITMFFIGASLSTDVLKAVGIKPLVQGVLLWIVISIGSLAYILGM